MKSINIAYQHLLETADTLGHIDEEPIEKTIEILKKAKKDGNQVFLFGNGGSHSNASHFANDLLKACGVKAICISDMIPTILAYANDWDYSYIFKAPLHIFWTKKDIMIGFSCSGNSHNVLTGFALIYDMKTDKNILFTGDHGGLASEKDKFCKTLIKVPHPNIRIQESCHSAICHAIVEALLED